MKKFSLDVLTLLTMISILVQKTGTIVFAQSDLTWKNWSNVVVYARKYGMNARAFLARQGRENQICQGKRAHVQSG